ncbi:hypothetical protein COCON_G00100400 [Conger conger]|uniref:Uncharacterized protein n=1 Tax=Conger conger TaxID=82655 RepID=A0A9Q1HXB6_CONCO|nr:hypothetical protein COCON_G00100400 [Conger conger]
MTLCDTALNHTEEPPNPLLTPANIPPFLLPQTISFFSFLGRSHSANALEFLFKNENIPSQKLRSAMPHSSPATGSPRSCPEIYAPYTAKCSMLPYNHMPNVICIRVANTRLSRISDTPMVKSASLVSNKSYVLTIILLQKMVLVHSNSPYASTNPVFG